MADNGDFEEARQVMHQIINDESISIEDETVMGAVNELKVNCNVMEPSSYNSKARKDMQYSSYLTSKNRRENR